MGGLSALTEFPNDEGAHVCIQALTHIGIYGIGG